MLKKTIQTSFLFLTSILLSSCGTFAGLGKDLQVVGRGMEKTENFRLFPQTNTQATTSAQYPTYRPYKR